MPFFDPPAHEAGRLHAAAAERNREPILDVLRRVLPPTGLVLEIASGTGQHVAFFARALPALRWQPSDPSPAHLLSIRAWSSEGGVDNLAAPVALDVEAQPWPVAHADAIVNINMIHIAPWSATEALFRGAARLLPAAGVLFLYGPFSRDGRHTAESNQRFDERLRGEDARWGVRDLVDVQAVAAGGASCRPRSSRCRPTTCPSCSRSRRGTRRPRTRRRRTAPRSCAYSRSASCAWPMAVRSPASSFLQSKVTFSDWTDTTAPTGT